MAAASCRKPDSGPHSTNKCHYRSAHANAKLGLKGVKDPVGVDPFPIPMASISAPGGSQPSSGWTTGEPWFSKTSGSAHRAAKKPLPKTILGRRTGRLHFKTMILPPKAPNSAKSRRGMGSFLPETPATNAPKHLFRPLLPRNPLFPALRTGPTAVSAAPAKSKFLAAQQSFKMTWISTPQDAYRLRHAVLLLLLFELTMAGQ